jgi:hypothetical protein
MQALRMAMQELSGKGFEVSLELLGSINFGIVDPSSDMDCILLLYCDLHAREGECPKDCSNIHFTKEEIQRFLNSKLFPEHPKIEFLDIVNLRTVENRLRDKDLFHDDLLFRLLFYRSIGRPVNRPLFVNYCDLLEENQEFVEKFIPWASEALMGYLSTNQHRFSFSKYNERILSRGLDLPTGLLEELRKYLNSSP